MKFFYNFLSGIIGGMGNITPGLSGSALLVILGVYDKCIDAISNIFKDFKNHFLYLFPIGLGILLGTFLFSNIIKFCLENYSLPTSIIFVGFMIGTLPSLFEEASKEKFKKRYLIFLLISFFIGVSFLFMKNNTTIIQINPTFFSLIFIGILISASTIIPGISSTVLLTIIGVYNLYIDSITTLNLNTLIPIFIGFAIGMFLLSKIINFLLKKYYSYTFYSIIGFVIATIPALFITPLLFSEELIFSIVLGIIACFVTIYTFNKAKK